MKKIPKSYEQLVRLISEILPDASIDEDFEGQLVIYTGLEEVLSDDGSRVLKEFEQKI